MTATITTIDRLAVVKQYAAGKEDAFVVAANQHLTADQVHEIAASNGYPDLGKLTSAVDTLQRKVDQEASVLPLAQHADKAPHLRQVKSVVTPPPDSPRPERIATSPLRPADATAALLLKASESTRKRTQTLGKRISDQLVQLRDRLQSEADADRAVAERKARAAAEKRRNDEARHKAIAEVRTAEAALKAARHKAIAEVRTAEAALKAARHKLRRFKNHPGGTSPPSEPHVRGEDGRVATLTARRAHLADFYERHGIQAPDVHAWAKRASIDCPRQGMIPRAVLDAYDEAHP